MFRLKLFIVIPIIFLINCQVVRSETYYDSLPLLDGKVDGKQVEEESKQPPAIINTEKTHETETMKPETIPAKKALSHGTVNVKGSTDKKALNKPGILEGPKDLALINAEKNPASVLDANNPKMETPANRFNNPDISDTQAFKEYMKDLNQITNVLKEIQAAIIEGSHIQVFSAKVTTAGFLTEGFRNKYANGTQSKFETYRLVQEVVKNAMYTRNFWLNSNKLTSNTRGMTDKILQTKLLQMNTEIDKLLNIIDLQTTLTKE